MTLEGKRFCDFGPFRLDRRQRLLFQGGAALSLAPKAFDVLLVLVERRDRVVSKDELMLAVWPDVVVEEGNLSQNIFLLRKALGQGQDAERVIVTVPGRGYRFVAEAIDFDEKEESVAPPAPPMSRSRRPLALGALLGLATLVGLAGFWVWRPAPPPAPFSERQLTTQAMEASLTAAAISPDGRYLAFADDHGFYVRVVATGETHLLAAPPGVHVFRIAWFSDGTKLLLSGQADPPAPSGVWLISILGGPVRKLRDDASAAVPSPDGSQIAFTAAAESEVWVMGANGEGSHRVVSGAPQDGFNNVGWFPDGQRIVYERSPVIDASSIESIDLKGAPPTVVVSVRGVNSPLLLPDGRLLYSVGFGAEKTSTLWDVRVDLKTGRAASQTRQIARWPGGAISSPSVTTDGKRVALLRGRPEADVYLAEIEEQGGRLRNPRRLTLDDGDDWMSSWTPDSESVLFFSTRNGLAEVFIQGIEETTAHAIVGGKAPTTFPRLSPDGQWVLYYDPPAMPSWRDLGRIRRVALAGGPAEDVMAEKGLYVFRCAREPAGGCIAGIMREKELVFYALDPKRGKGKELARTETQPDLYSYGVDLSPDGSQLAIVSLDLRPGRIRILGLGDGTARDLAVPGFTSLGHVYWAADGQSFYVSSEEAFASTLLFVRPDGTSPVLCRQPTFYAEIWGIPSPDGKHLAFVRHNSGNNAWLLENF